MKAEARAAGDLALVVKGIMTAEDVAIAAGVGVDGVIISNHGGRQLDGTDGPIEIVAECVEAAAGRCDVFMDGGIRRGKDVYKALALGAKAVFIGRQVVAMQRGATFAYARRWAPQRGVRVAFT